MPHLFTTWFFTKQFTNPGTRDSSSKMVHSHGSWQQVMLLVTWASPLATWVLVHKCGSCLGEIWKWTPYTKDKERLKKEADHFRLVGGSFNQQGNLHSRLVLGGCKMSRSLYWPTRILEVYRQRPTRTQSCTQSRWSQPYYSLKVTSLKPVPLWERWAEQYIPRTGSSSEVMFSWWPPPTLSVLTTWQQASQEQVIQERKEGRNHNVFLWSGLRGDIATFLYSIGHREEPRYKMGGTLQGCKY